MEVTMPDGHVNEFACGCIAPADQHHAQYMECPQCLSGDYSQSMRVRKPVIPQPESQKIVEEFFEDSTITSAGGRRNREAAYVPNQGARTRSRRNLSKVQRKRVRREAERARAAEIASQEEAGATVIPFPNKKKDRTDESHRPTYVMSMIHHSRGRR